MCMDKVDKIPKHYGYGYKVIIDCRTIGYDKVKPTFSPVFQFTCDTYRKPGTNGSKPFKFRRWLDSKDYQPVESEGLEYIEAGTVGSYPTGFHCFATLGEARSYMSGLEYYAKQRCVVVRAKLSDIVATGKGMGYTNIVCRKIFLFGDVLSVGKEV